MITNEQNNQEVTRGWFHCWHDSTKCDDCTLRNECAICGYKPHVPLRRIGNQ